MYWLAAIQMTSGADKARNVDAAVRWTRQAVARGAALVGLPESFNWLGPEAGRLDAAESLDGPTLSALAQLARELSITLVAGSILETGATPGPQGPRLFNTSVVLGPDGARLGVYRKMHLFDVDLDDGTPPYRESASIAPGKDVVTADTPVAKVGLSVCYDVRFPELYRRLAHEGATLLTVPAAFTATTGKDHWEALLRARAIENQAYVLAPAQWGTHFEKRTTYGHALVVDPWGLVIARCSEGEGFALAAYDPERLNGVRRRLPALQHRRLV